MSLKDGGGSSTRHTFLGGREGGNSTAFSWDRSISGPPTLWAAIPFSQLLLESTIKEVCLPGDFKS